MLYRMYTRYCERRGWTVRELDMLDGDDAGVKSVTFEVDGENAYGYLKAEKGVHRLVRISPFDSSGRRHTSFSSLDVTPIFDDDTGDIKIDPDDLRIDTFRASGAGGQHVNKTSSAIRITHMPTNTVVQCQNERSQLQNKETAMRMLRGKLLELQEREREEQMSQIKGEMKKIEWGSQIRSYVFPAVYAGEGSPHGRGKRQHSGSHGRGPRTLYPRVSRAVVKILFVSFSCKKKKENPNRKFFCFFSFKKRRRAVYEIRL